MNKKELALLGRAYAAEINAAFSNSEVHVMQTKAKLADKLVADGLLRRGSARTLAPWPCTVDGYELTDAGWVAYYCMTC